MFILTTKCSIILLTHGGWGKALIKSVEMIVGKTEKVYDVSLDSGLSLQTYIQKVRSSVDTITENDLVLTDIPGGTTSNVALRLSQEFPWHIISGVNALMLIEATMHQEAPLTNEILNTILEAGKNSQSILALPNMEQDN